MGKRKYSDAQIVWLEVNGYSKVWSSRKEFRDAFNQTFGLEVGEYQFNNLVEYYKIKICTQQTESLFTPEQKQWLIENAQSGKYKNCKHLTDTYNALFKECRSHQNVIGYLFTWGVPLKSKYKEQLYSEEMDDWIRENYLTFLRTDDFTEVFNKRFGTNKSVNSITKHCRSIGLRRESTRFHHGGFSYRTADLYTIKRREDGYFYIKVNMKNDKTSWIQLHKFVWEQNYGKVPKGYCVIFLSDNHDDLSLNNLGLIDRRGTVMMAKFGWFTENRAITKTGAEWCNLYLTARDNGIYA